MALCTFNGARYLRRQLDTIASQTRLPFELVVTDDGSSDGTLEVLAAFAAEAPFAVRVVRNETRLGYQRNFMKAAALTSGDVTFFCDQDDIWEDGKIDTVCRLFETGDALLIYHNAAVVDEAERKVGTLYNGQEQHAVLAQEPMAPWHSSQGFTQAVRRELRAYHDLWETLPTPDVSGDDAMAHDRYFFFLASTFGRILFLDEELARYRQHGSNVCGVEPEMRGMKGLINGLAHNPEWDRWAGDAAECRAGILDALVERVPSCADRLKRLSSEYRRLAERYCRRERTYAARSRLARLQAWVQSVRSGDYAADPWTLGGRAMPRDLLVGVALGQSTTRRSWA